MCGIVGVIDFSGRPVARETLAAMTRTMAHRGPDGEGVLAKGNVGLGHRRLAIIDLSQRAAQPMTSADGRRHLVYNGELYNFRELRRELEAEGASFRSDSDTEVVLQALTHWGEKALERFNGMFGLALWDEDRREILLARDRYGVKPLYVARRGELFVFASEAKAIAAHPGFETRLDHEGLLEYFTFQNFLSRRTLFRDVETLPPGHWMKANGERPLGGPRQYWDFDFSEPCGAADEREYVEELDRLFSQAVRRQLVSDVGVGSYLSGGMDSGSITAVAASERPGMRTFTCGFDLGTARAEELDFDERSAAARMARAFRTEHHEAELDSARMIQSLPDIVYHLDEPRVGQSYPNYYAAKMASEHVKVVLCGTGGDELFGGYPWRYYRAVSNASFDEYVDTYYGFWQRLIPNRVIRQVFAPVWPSVKDVWTRDIFQGVFKRHARRLCSPEDYVNHSLYFECKTFLHGLLHVADKLSMAHGLESRVPFLDNDLVDFAVKVPVRMKLRDLTRVAAMDENEPGPKQQKYFQRTNDGKILLRRMLSRYVDDSITNGVKKGFSGPDASWFRGESIGYVRRTLFSRETRLFDYFDREAILELVLDHLEGRANRRLLVWSLLSFEQWCRRFLG
ncbi:asparagine synthase (glutamine-hydrolyzing) [Desulfohalovibrio reitneri]|uniref:asparagine synthase (glutamine-hydrolyzing) n=1 Tax=Desulfohalovibrio reitneri TaxID=1307759 RepID=UPI0004A6BA54|nr:asparagine synthase (glutamine-hydrolyzing) [Desulfohalovibrio reitneri]